jgi:hypothetical protein
MKPSKPQSLNEEISYRRGYSQAVSSVLCAIGAREHAFIDAVLTWRHSSKDLMDPPPELDDEDINQIRELIKGL